MCKFTLKAVQVGCNTIRSTLATFQIVLKLKHPEGKHWTFLFRLAKQHPLLLATKLSCLQPHGLGLP